MTDERCGCGLSIMESIKAHVCEAAWLRCALADRNKRLAEAERRAIEAEQKLTTALGCKVVSWDIAKPSPAPYLGMPVVYTAPHGTQSHAEITGIYGDAPGTVDLIVFPRMCLPEPRMAIHRGDAPGQWRPAPEGKK